MGQEMVDARKAFVSWLGALADAWSTGDRTDDPLLRRAMEVLESRPPNDQSMIIHEAPEVLQRLESVDDRKAEIAKMRLIWSMSLTQIADLLEVSLSTIEREWRFARAWIAFEVGLA